MTPLRSILRMRLSLLRNAAHHVKKDSLAKTFVVFFGLGNVIGIGFFVSYKSFKFIEEFPAFGAALVSKMVALLFFALLVLVILSTIIVTHTTVFLARETEYLFHHPIRPRTIFFLKLSEAIAFSSWATLFLCLPVLVAFGFLRGASAAYYLEIGVILTLFLLFAGLSGAALSILLAPLLKVLTPRQLLGIGGLLLAILGWIFLRSFKLLDLDDENNLLVLDRFTSQLTAMHSPYFPSNWASSAVLAAVVGRHSEVAFQTGTLLANTLVFLPFLSWYGARQYGSQWIGVRGAMTGREGPRRTRRGERGLSRGPLTALSLKDVRLFVRDPSQLSQSILFIALMVIYSLSLMRIPRYLTTGDLQLLIYFANLGAVCMILSSITSRFLFPLLSLEGRAFWVLGLAPIRRADLIRQKARLGLGVSLSLGLITIVVSNALIRSPPDLFAGAVYTMVLAATCLTSLATGLGAAYPVFEEDNPARIAVGLGGTLNFFASALAVALLITIEALPYLLAGQEPGAWVAVAHVAALAFTALLSGFCLRLGARNLERMEF
jgi:ABC-2 type transport system permease protein